MASFSLMILRGAPFRLRHRWAPALASCLLLLSSSSWAQSSSDKAAAEALFDQGIELLKEGNTALACKKLQSSQRIDPGIGTLLYLGECFERLGKTASAWATFREAASKATAAGEAGRARQGNVRADALEPQLSYLTVHVGEPNKVIEGLTVVQAGVTTNPAVWGSAVPVDPGEIEVVVSAPGYEAFEATITVEKQSKDASLEVPPLVKLPEPEVLPTTGSASGNSATLQDRADRRTLQLTTGFVAGGLGIIGIGLGSVYGVMALNKDQDANDVCGNDTVCPAGSSGQQDSLDAVKFGNISTGAFVAGGVLLASGAVLVLTAPKKQSLAVRISPTLGGGRLALGGSF